MKSCATCEYFHRFDMLRDRKAPNGECRFNPPSAGANLWPVVQPEHWCGKWSEAPCWCGHDRDSHIGNAGRCATVECVCQAFAFTKPPEVVLREQSNAA